MGNLAIQVEGLSKRYRIGGELQAYRTLREIVAGTFSAPFKPGTNGRTSDTIWALKDNSFEVEQGEILGVIGRNGAGKSTLLKILSRITRPTTGMVRLRGRVGSLLEVGTGFHPELTGRENIYLNGAILGMRRVEIERNFERIVEFAEIDQYLNTPVKRYSSGMYMRLAFAVAAHLEPEILLVDEVLAVGDAGFQKKCLGKMGQVAGEGRTVLFVSHNMAAVRSICPRSILLSTGRIIDDGPSDQVVRNYLNLSFGDSNQCGEITWDDLQNAPGGKEVKLRSIRLLSGSGQAQGNLDISNPFQVEFIYNVYSPIRGMRCILVIATRDGVRVFATTDHDQRPAETLPGIYRGLVTIPGGLLNAIQYSVQVHLDIPGFRTLVPGDDFLYFTGVGNTPHGSHFPENWPGVIAPMCEWREEKLE